MESDPEVAEFEFVVQPYQFEPGPNRQVEETSTDESESQSESSSSHSDDDQSDVHLWCKCGNCRQMPTQIERKCCQDIQLCISKMEGENLICISSHEGFIANCLNRHVLELAFYEYLDDYGPVGNEEPIHDLYRHIAYRRFARWIWHRLGKKVRKVIPSCVINKIRDTFPSETYTGFKYPRDY